MCASSFQPFYYLPTQEINLFCLLCILLYSLFLSLNWTWAAESQRGVQWKAEKGRRRMKEKELGRWWALRQLRPAEPFQLAHNCSPATEALLSIRIFPLSLAPLLKHKRGEQAWAGIIGSFLSPSAMCKDNNNGRESGGEMIQSEIFTCSLQRGLCSFQSMLMCVRFQSATVKL